LRQIYNMSYISAFFLFYLLSFTVLAQESESPAEFVNDSADKPLLSNKPEASRVLRRRIDSDFGFTELTFVNGVQIILKSTDFDSAQILFSGFSPGGKSLYLNEDFMSAYMATTIVKSSGLGDFDKMTLSKKLDSSRAMLYPYIDELYEGINGSTASGDLETLLQLNYLYFTSVRRDEAAFNDLISYLRQQAAEIETNMIHSYLNTLYSAVTNNSPRTVTIPTEEQIERIRHNHALNIYSDRFSDASDFKFVMVGNFDINAVTPLLETYLGGLPSRNRIETWRDVTPQFPPDITVIKRSFQGERSRVDIIQKGDFRWNIRERIQFSIFSDVLNIRMLETRLEVDNRGKYEVDISGSVSRFPNPRYSLDIIMHCEPENVNGLISTLFTEIEDLKAFGATVADLNRAKEALISERKKAIEDNRYWLNTLLGHYRNGDRLMTLNEYNRIVNSVRPRDIRRIARQYFKETNYVMGILSPYSEN